MGTHLIHLLSKCHECFVTSRQNKIASQDNVHYIQGNAHNLVFFGCYCKCRKLFFNHLHSSRL